MEQSSLSELRGYFIRPASITFRFTDANETAYREAATTYNTVLTFSKTAASESEEVAYYFYQFRVNQDTNEEQDIELRLEHRKRDNPELQSRTIIYWAISPNDIVFIKEKLLSLGYRLLEEDVITIKKKIVAQRFIAQSPTGNLIAGHTNPPFPLTKRLRHQYKRANEFMSNLNPTTKLLASLFLGPILLGVVTLLRSRKR